jgi:UDP-N-acetylmuramate dehydrogenase
MVKEPKLLNLAHGLAGDYLFNEPLRRHTSFRIGGPAELLAVPCGEPALSELLGRIKRQKLKYYVLGNGSNLLAEDRGFKGVVIKIDKGFKNWPGIKTG